MSELPAPETFEEFWPYYVSQHQNPTSRALHFVGTSLALACVAATPVMPPAILAAPVFGYGFAWLGHFAFEKNRPATWGSPKFAVWSLRGDFRMWRRIVTGTMQAELDRTHADPSVDVAA
jgi:hypothetical protein